MADIPWDAIGKGVQVGGQLALNAQGQAAGDAERAKAEALIREQLAKLGMVPEPSFVAELAQQMMSEAGNVTSDPGARTAQMQALERLAQIDRDGGLTLSDRAALNEVQGQTAQADAQNRAALAGEFQRRGQLGAGAQLAMSMQGQQSAANRMSQEGMDIAGKAQQRALQAVMSRGQMAGAMRDQSFNEDFKTKSARDAIKQWNAGQTRDAGRYNNTLRQQQFGNRTSKITGAMPGTNALAGIGMKNADNTQQRYANYGVGWSEATKDLGTKAKAWWDEPDEDEDKKGLVHI